MKPVWLYMLHKTQQYFKHLNLQEYPHLQGLSPN